MLARQVRAPLGGRFALATVLLVGAAFAFNNLAPYLGMTYAGAMTMYSGLDTDADNHLFMPKLALSDSGTYVWVVRREARGVGENAAKPFKRLATSDEPERPLVHLNVVRYHASRACESAPNARLALTLQAEDGRLLEYENVCAEPSMLRYDVLTSQKTCKNLACTRVLRGLRDESVPAR